MLLVLLISALVAVGFMVQVWNIYIKPWSHIPCVGMTVPYLGNVLAFHGGRENEIKIFDSFFNNIGDTFMLWMMGRPVVLTRDVQIIEKVLTSNTLLTKGRGYRFFRDWVKDGLICSDGEKWRRRRKQLTHCFHFNLLKHSMKIMESHSQQLLRRLTDLAQCGDTFNVMEVTKYFSLCVISKCAMGIDLDSLDDGGRLRENYIKSVATVCNIMVKIERNPMLWCKPIFRSLPMGRLYCKSLATIQSFVQNTIETKIKEYQGNAVGSEKGNTKKILLDSLLELYENGEIDVDGVVEETNNFLFAGHDTVASSLAWSLYMLGSNKEAQAKAYKEVLDVSKRNLATIDEKVAALKYIDCVIKETLRLKPAAPFISRYLKEDLVIDGFIVPKGTDMAFNLISLHRNENYWPNATQFLPERFEDDNAARSKRSVFAYIPFSAGPRNCIGSRFALMEMKIALYHILLNFEIEATQKDCELQEVFDVVLYSANGIMLKVKKIH